VKNAANPGARCVIANTPAEAAAIMNGEEARLTKLIRDVGIPPE